MCLLWIFIFVYVLSAPQSWAAPAIANSKAEKYSSFFYKPTPSKESITKAATGNVQVAGSVLGQETQALFLMATLASVEGMKQQLQISGIKKEQASIEDLSKVAVSSANHLVQASETLAGMGGMKATTTAMEAPLNAWNTVVMNSSTNLMLKELIASSSANLVGFVGFEGGSELMSRAIQMIPDEEDRKKASKMVPTIWSSLTTKDPNQSQDEKRIISSVFSNMYKILVEDSDLREKWWSFVTRNRIQTGNFAFGVSMMSMGSVAGMRVGSCLPSPIAKIAAPAVGAAFGVTGGVAASFVPTGVKDEVTQKFQSARMGISTVQIKRAQNELKEALRKLDREEKIQQSHKEKRKNDDWKIENLDKQIDTEISNMLSSREDLMTSFYDRIHTLNSRLYSIQNKIQLAKEHQNVSVEKELTKEYSKYLQMYNENKKEIDGKLSEEISYFESLSKKTTSVKSSEKIKFQLEEVKSMKQWTGQFLGQVQSTSTWGQKLKSSNPQGLMSEQENQRLLEKFYMWGFKQKPFLETMEFNN